MKNTSVVAIDLAKESFFLRAITHTGKVVREGKVRRDRVLSSVLNAPQGACIAMEACASSHYWGRKFIEHGYEVRLIPPDLVKPYVKSQKNDRADAEGIGEAATRDTMRFVPVKSELQQEVQAIHRVRSRLKKEITALGNEIRGLIGEFGYVVPRGFAALRRWCAELENTELSDRIKRLIQDCYEQLVSKQEGAKRLDAELKRFARSHDTCRRLLTIPGVGVMTSTALFAAAGAGEQFKNGRSMGAWLGLVPRQFSTGGKAKLGRITKRGDSYLRQLLVHGARSVVAVAPRRTDNHGLWVNKVRQERGFNKAAVALANKNARIAWAIIKNPEEVFRADHVHQF